MQGYYYNWEHLNIYWNCLSIDSECRTQEVKYCSIDACAGDARGEIVVREICCIATAAALHYVTWRRVPR